MVKKPGERRKYLTNPAHAEKAKGHYKALADAFKHLTNTGHHTEAADE